MAVAVVVCDEQLLFAEALAAVLRRRGACASAVADEEALLGLEDLATASHVVLGVNPARPPSAEAFAGIRRACPGTMLICAGVDDTSVASSLVESGADLVLSKKRPLGEIVQAVLGHPSGSQAPSRRSPCGSRSARRADGRPLAAQFLTVREREVLRLLVSGESTQGIARALGVTRATARSHVQSVLGRLGVHSRVEAVRYAVFHSLVELRDRPAGG